MFDSFQTASIFKESASNLKVWQLRHWEVMKFVNQNKIRSVLDLGCNEGKLIQKLERGVEAQLLVGLDIDTDILEETKQNIRPEPLQNTLMMDRQHDQRIKLYHGSALSQYQQLRQMNFQLITLIEVIQHLQPYMIDDLNQNIFKFLNPPNVIISTPNKDFNHFFKWDDDKKMRHDDHKFQWTQKQFLQYVETVSAKYNYKYEIFGVGQHVTDNSRGFCTQIVLFKRNQNNFQKLKMNNLNQIKLTLICEFINKSWRNCQQQLLKQAIYNSLIYFQDRVQWQEGINYLKRTKIFRLLSGQSIQPQQSLSNSKAIDNSIVTKQLLINIFKTMKSSVDFDYYGYQRVSYSIQEQNQFAQDCGWHKDEQVQNIPQNCQYKTPDYSSILQDSNNSFSITNRGSNSLSHSFQRSMEFSNVQLGLREQSNSHSNCMNKINVSKIENEDIYEQKHLKNQNQQFPGRAKIRLLQCNNNLRLSQPQQNSSQNDSWGDQN